MATAKKVAAKAAPKKTVAKAPVKKVVSTKAIAKVRNDEQFAMPMEVKEWIDQAMSRLRSMQSKIDRLEVENRELKSYKRWAEHRILGSAPE